MSSIWPAPPSEEVPNGGSVSEITGMFLFAGSTESRCKLDHVLCMAQHARSLVSISLKVIAVDWCDGPEFNVAEQMVLDRFCGRNSIWVSGFHAVRAPWFI